MEEPSCVRIAGHDVAPGTRRRIELDFARLPGQRTLALPLEVVVGNVDKPVDTAPRVWLSAAIHGDEINGLEIIRRVLELLDPEQMRGTVLAVPIVNMFGFALQNRYMPDRRDLNRSFPGARRGSLASRLAHFFMSQVVDHCTHGIDLHTGSNHRTNLPQIRADLDHPVSREMAQAFAAPVMVHGSAPPGSLREAVAKAEKPIVVYEAGEVLRFDEEAIQLGTEGVLRTLSWLGVLNQDTRVVAPRDDDGCGTGPNLEVRRKSWLRAPVGGIFVRSTELGSCVEKGEALGHIHEALGDEHTRVDATRAGIVIGHTNNPLVYQGDALVHLAHVEA